MSYLLDTYKRNYTEFEYGINATLFDKDGRDYIDFTSGIAVTSVGHGNKRLIDAITEQAKKYIHLSNLYYIKEQEILAKKLVDSSGYDMKCFFCNSGAEANEGAIKIARKFGEDKRYKVITLRQSFHGRTITTLKATAQDSMHNYFGPYPDGFVYAVDLDEVYNLIDNHTVAVMIELVQGEGGVNAFSKHDIQKLSTHLKANDLLLIVDEVQTGIYRSGDFLASNLYEIEPDIITLAKGLAGGVPIGAIMTRLKDIFTYGDHGSTFGGNPLSTRAGNEVLDILREEFDSGAINERIILFNDYLEDIV